jgi:hypothetical protein
MPMPIILDVKNKSGKVERVKLPVEIWQKNTEWSFKHDSTEEIESITLDPDHVFDSNEANNGLLPKELLKRIYFRWVFRNFFNAQSPMKITFLKKTVFLVLTQLSAFSVEPLGKDL